MRQLSPKRGRRYLYQTFIKHFCLFYKKPEQSATPKDIPPCGGKTFALRVSVALMNIWFIFKNPPARQAQSGGFIRLWRISQRLLCACLPL